MFWNFRCHGITTCGFQLLFNLSSHCWCLFLFLLAFSKLLHVWLGCECRTEPVTWHKQATSCCRGRLITCAATGGISQKEAIATVRSALMMDEYLYLQVKFVYKQLYKSFIMFTYVSVPLLTFEMSNRFSWNLVLTSWVISKFLSGFLGPVISQ
jgi:hypothetical protein